MEYGLDWWSDENEVDIRQPHCAVIVRVRKEKNEYFDGYIVEVGTYGTEYVSIFIYSKFRNAISAAKLLVDFINECAANDYPYVPEFDDERFFEQYACLFGLTDESEDRKPQYISPKVSRRLSGRRVYILLMENGRIKIGITNNINTRLRSIEGACGFKIVRYCYSEECNEHAQKIESLCHQHFADYRCEVGEFFNGVTFDDARDYLQTLVKIDYDS